MSLSIALRLVRALHTGGDTSCSQNLLDGYDTKGERGMQDRTTTVAVIGLGKIGLPLAVLYAQAGCRVFGCDYDAHVVASINAGLSHVQGEPDLAEAVSHLVASGLLSATQDTSLVVRCVDVVVVIVPVSLTPAHEVDFTQLDAATRALGLGLQAGTLVIYETTLPVGTTRCRLARLLEETSGFCAGRDFYLAHSPE